ncbi:LGFP repeat-containing protein [Nocardia sp. NRRL S-836]|uniref:LGFP repeat-containing protein n=1 Tax=Nocardia sp. NRRL S-836 TaxID=1519492 RepID=UPI0009EC157C|nr:hypothetical protein [Nocardia sp. NRRL S-836]
MKVREFLGTSVVAVALVMGMANVAAADDMSVMFNCGTYPAGKQTARDEALARSTTWLQARVPYSQSACHNNQFGSYRTDCSGYLSMVWGLGHSYTTATLHEVSHTINRADLQPGDALNWPGQHTALFIGWADAARTMPRVREQAGPNGSPTTERNWAAATAAKYTPIRYNNIVSYNVYGDIGAKWRAMGAEGSVVGAPVNNEADGAPGGRWQGFQRGNIYWTPALNAHPVYGDIHTRFMNTGDEHRWGYPVNDESAGANGGRWQGFQVANFYWTAATGAFPVYGDILTNFMNAGDEHRWGYPLMEEAAGANGGRYQKFQNGVWYWSARTNAYPVYGDILTKFAATGDEHTHGYPKEAEKEWTGETGGRMQVFENSTFYWTAAKGAWSVQNAG